MAIIYNALIKPIEGWPQVNNGDKMKEFVAFFA